MGENPQMRIQETNRKSALLVFIFVAVGGIPALHGAVNVTQYHNHENRDGRYVDPAFTRSAAALKRDTNFSATFPEISMHTPADTDAPRLCRVRTP